jgi:hypothetical protein
MVFLLFDVCKRVAFTTMIACDEKSKPFNCSRYNCYTFRTTTEMSSCSTTVHATVVPYQFRSYDRTAYYRYVLHPMMQVIINVLLIRKLLC